MSVVIKKKSDVKKLKAGEAYILDVFPPADQEDQTVTQKMLDERDQLQKYVEEHLAKSDKKKNA